MGGSGYFSARFSSRQFLQLTSLQNKVSAIFLSKLRFFSLIHVSVSQIMKGCLFQIGKDDVIPRWEEGTRELVAKLL